MRNLFAFILLLLWLTFGCWYYLCQVKGFDCEQWRSWFTPEKKEEKIDPVKLKTAYGDVFKTEENISIRKSNPYLVKGDEFDEGLEGIATFLNDHPNTNLNIIGLYDDREDNETGFSNLGLARAEAIKEELISLGVQKEQLLPEAQVDTTLFAANDTISNSDVINFKFSEKYAELNEGDVKETFRSLGQLPEYIQFNKGSDTVRIAQEGNASVEKLKYYLNKNNEYILEIDVPYTSDEEVEDAEIGKKRSDALLALLTNAGVDRERIEMRQKEMEGIFDDANKSLPGMTTLNFRFPDKSDDKIKEAQLERNLEKSLTDSTSEVALADTVGQKGTNTGDGSEESLSGGGDNVDSATVNDHPNIEFDYGSARLEATTEVVNYAEELSQYLGENSEKKVYIIGHTDNISSANFNYRLGLRRARAARELMRSHSILTDKMETSSKGENQPIATNDTDEGRQKNRRVEIDIK